MTSAELKTAILELAHARPPHRTPAGLRVLAEFRAALNRGEIRAAEPVDGGWEVNLWVKKGIALHLAMGALQNSSHDGKGSNFELDTFPQRRFTAEDRVRIPPGGSWVRDGAYLAPGVTCLPPSVINMGAWLGRGTTVDSHVSIGMCTQLGERVHVTSGTQIGGVIAPPERLPTIIGDDVLICGSCGIYDGVEIGAGAIVGAGVIITGDTRVYDIRRDAVYFRDGEQGMRIPPMAVVLMGTRPMTTGPGARLGLHAPAPVIAGYRDDPGFHPDSIHEMIR